MGVSLILDCGCGDKPSGDVNLDYTYQTAFNFIRGDAHHLPFKNKVFKKTICSTVLEHLNKPYDALRELFRVTNGEVIIRYDRFSSIYNFIGVGHKHLMIMERFVWIPQCIFVFLRYFFKFKPIKYLARKGRLFEANTYEKFYCV